MNDLSTFALFTYLIKKTLSFCYNTSAIIFFMNTAISFHKFICSASSALNPSAVKDINSADKTMLFA